MSNSIQRFRLIRERGIKNLGVNETISEIMVRTFKRAVYSPTTLQISVFVRNDEGAFNVFPYILIFLIPYDLILYFTDLYSLKSCLRCLIVFITIITITTC